ncbi:unnamed protein product [Calypogeia fissa]
MPTRQLLQSISQNSAQPPSHPASKSNQGLVLGLAIGGAAGVALFLVAFLLVLYRWLRSSRRNPFQPSPVKLQKFSYRELKNATDNFSPAQRLGQGGFGVVFKGALRNGKDIAVKKLDTSSLQGEREFQNEVSVIGKVNSPHVVGLLGYCADGKKRLLVYEYMENGSLQEALFDEMYAASLDWETRFKIILDTARGLAFLHYKCDPPIIHGDVKPSNILLDKHFSARIADFGLARLKSEETGATTRSEEIEREQIERERIRCERIERERARRARRRREDAERKRSAGTLAGSQDAKAGGSLDKEGSLEKSPLGRVDDILVIPAPQSPATSVNESIVPEDNRADCYGTTHGSPLTLAEEPSPHQVEIDISGPSVAQSPLSMLPSPATMQSSPSIRQDSPVTDTVNSPASIVEIVPSDAGKSECGSPADGKKDGTEETSPADSASKGAKQVDDAVSNVPDVSVKEETEPEGWSTISPSEGYRDDVSVESGRSGKELHRGSGTSHSKRLWNRDWWWRQDTNSGELTIKDFINWTPSKSIASDGKKKTPSSREWGAGIASSGDITPLSQSLRVDKKKVAELKRHGSRSSLGSDGWGEFSGELTGKKKEDKRGKDKYTMREWWKEENSGEVGKSKREHAKSKSRDSSSSKVGKSKSREWWREEKSGELGQNRLPKSGPLLSLSREGSKREKTRSREWWREEHSGELSRTNSNRHSGQLRKDSGRREKSRSRDWFSGDFLGRAAVSSTPSMRGTICYVAPEYGGGGILNEKSDVYSFGVLMLVIISGRRPLQVMASPIVEFERANLISWARHLAQSGNVLDLVDGMLHGQYSKEQAVLCITVALLCLQRLPAVRPTMGEVVKILLGESDLPSLPFDFSPSPPYFRSRRKPSADRAAAPSVKSDAPLLP